VQVFQSNNTPSSFNGHSLQTVNEVRYCQNESLSLICKRSKKKNGPFMGCFSFCFGVSGFEQWKGETGRFHLLRKGIGKPEGFPRRRSRLRIAQRQVPEQKKLANIFFKLFTKYIQYDILVAIVYNIIYG